MPRIKHVVECDYTPTFRSQKVAGMFDVPVADKLRKEWDVDFPIEERGWQIGLIVGASGSGKTTLAGKAFDTAMHQGFEWGSQCLLDDFPKDIDVTKITETLSKVGFSSPPQWLLPYSALSNGQKFRVELARCLLEYEGLFVFDEFTSVVDRTVAKVGAHAFQKAVRRSGKQFVAVTCHYDVEEWLQPDWVLDVSTGEFKWGCLRRPELKVEIYRCDHKAWRLFEGHHYLSASINKSARVYVAEIDGEPVGIAAALPFPHPKVKNTWKEHRTVVLPDYQGLGLGNMLSEFVGDRLLSEGRRYVSTTSHPSMVFHRQKSPKWAMTRSPGRTGRSKGALAGSTAHQRLTASFRYVGDVDSTQPAPPRV